jgi:YHS domain-containing protein
MKIIKTLTATILAVSVLGGPFLALGADEKPEAKLKPYTLTTCIVSGDKLGEMGAPFEYKYKDREIKFCCKNCVKDFNKDPEKYIKKIEKAEKKEAKAAKP